MEVFVRIDHDEFAESPSTWGGWTIKSFSRRHNNFDHPSNYLNENGKPVNVGINRKLNTGTAFILSYYEHSGSLWFRKANMRPSDKWDTVYMAGVAIWCGSIKDLPRGYNARAEFLDQFLEEYNSWVNGEVFSIAIIDKNNEVLDSVSDVYYGKDGFKNIVSELLPKGAEVIGIIGNGAHGLRVDDLI